MTSDAAASTIPTGEGSGSCAADQRPQRLEAHVGGEGEERERHQPQRLPFPGLGHPVTELPQDDEAAGDLDHRVQPEPDQGHGPGNQAGADGDDGLEDVVGHRDPGQQLRAPPSWARRSSSGARSLWWWRARGDGAHRFARTPKFGHSTTASPVRASICSAAASSTIVASGCVKEYTEDRPTVRTCATPQSRRQAQCWHSPWLCAQPEVRGEVDHPVLTEREVLHDGQTRGFAQRVEQAGSGGECGLLGDSRGLGSGLLHRHV